MYPYRLVVDANCLNAKGRLVAMTALEQYHDAGAIELIVTSTLHAELENGSSQAIKAESYQSVGGHIMFLSGARSAQAMPGATVRPSLLGFLHERIFGPNLSGHTLTRAIRDCLHLDQAQMNAADVFVTNDKRLYSAEAVLALRGVSLRVLSPEDALAFVQTYLQSTIGTEDVRRAKTHVDGLGPLILGSNSFPSCDFIAGDTQERLVALRIQDGLLHVEANIRDEAGEVIVRLRPGQRPEFLSHSATLTQVGPGPILAGEESMNTIVLSSDRSIFLAIRTTHNARAVVYGMELRDQSGHIVASVQRDQVILHGAGLVL